MSTRALLQDAIQPLQLLDVEDAGGMGEIHLARDPDLRRTLAVKVLHTELANDPEARKRFEREARVVAGLSHANVVNIYTVGELADGTPYFVMDYVEGGSFAQRLEEEGPLSVSETRSVLGQVASALEAAHARGVVHRDIKASNVLFDRDTGRALVTDWGIAALDPSSELSPDTRLTRAGAVVGSPYYMSPEQLAGDEVGPETDVYALGLLAFELLTGDGPFPAETPRGIMTAHLRDDPPRLSEVREEVDPELDALVDRCLSKTPRDRPRADELTRLDPSGRAPLEWPPPGLEALHGKAYGAALWLGLPVATLSVPVAAWLAVGPRERGLMALVEGLGGMLLVALAMVLGSLALAWGLRKMGGLLLATARATRLGYGWRTLAEVLADRRGDTGLLMAGAREYAVMDAESRRRLRQRRVLAGAGVLGAAVLGPPAALIVAAATVADWWTVVLVIAILGLAVEWLRREPGALREARASFARSRTSAQHADSLVASWYRSMRSTVGGDPGPDEGRVWTPLAIVGAGAASLSVTAILLLALGAVLVLTARGETGFVDLSRTVDRWERIAPFTDLALEPDPDITPAEASRLLRDIRTLEDSDAAWRTDRPPQSTVEGSPLLAGTSPFDPPHKIQLDSIIRVAARGLSDAELAYLRGFTGDPRAETYASVARAAALDWYATGPDPEDDLSFFTPVRSWRPLRNVGYTRMASAAYWAASGRYEEAETALREVVSVGFLLAEHGTNLLQALIGVVTTRSGLQSLADLYEVTGREDLARRIRSGLGEGGSGDSPDAPLQVALLEEPEQTLAEARLEYYRGAADTTLPRPLRWTYLHELVPMTLCSNPRTILLGPSNDFEQYLEALEPTLVRYPSDEALFEGMVTNVARMHEELPEVLRGPARASPLRLRLLLRGVRVSARALGTPRLDGCLAIMLAPTMR